jgi:hypothetical protein
MRFRGKSVLAIGTLLVAGLSLGCTAEASRARDTKSTEPADSSGQVVIEDEVWYPWRFEPMTWEHNAWMHYRQREEKAAAHELRKAESWLKLAASHALPRSRSALDSAASDLHSVAADLEQGNVVKAARLGYAVARADDALAQWHYFKARENAAQSEEGDAALHLRTAARYLEHAADSARSEYGPETTSFFEDIDEYGRVIDEGVAIEPADLAGHLDALERELKKMEKVLDATADRHVAG